MIRNINDPKGNPQTATVENQLGKAYDVVEAVEANLPLIVRVVQKLDQVGEAETLIDARNDAEMAAENAAVSETNAATSASLAQASKTGAEIAAAAADASKTLAQNAQAIVAQSATAAANSATSAESSKTSASQSAASAQANANSAATSATNASSSASLAQSSASAAGASATSAGNSATLANSAAATATTKANDAAASASAAADSDSSAQASKVAAAASQVAAATSATAASASATAADTSATSAAASASAANTASTTATTQAGIATTKANEASASAATAVTKASEAAGSAASASTSASTTVTKASEASVSAAGAAASAASATASASEASASASSAATSATQAAASYDSFDDRYLGAKASNPTLDNDGNTLLVGALYWNTAANEMRVWSGSTWVVTYTPAGSTTFSGNITVPDELAYDTTGSALPAVAPVLNLNFVQSNVVDPRITFTRSSTATLVGSNGLIQIAAANTPRLDYDPATLAPKGLLVEEQRTNLLVRSEEFDNASWSKIEATITANAAISPDGTADAEKFIPSANAVSHYVNQSVTSTTTQCTGSVYVKLDGSAVNKVTLFPGSSGTFAHFNLSTLTSSGEANVASTLITNVGNGWYRLSATWVAGITVSALRIYASSGTFGAALVAGDGTSGIFLYGAQLETGSFATSYIPTLASQVTRSADFATMTGTSFSSWYNQSEGTFVAEGVSTVSLFNINSLYTASDGTQNNRLVSTLDPATHGAAIAGGVASALLDSGTPSVTVPNKVAFAFKANDFAVSLNGGAVVTDTSGALPAVDRLVIGSNGAGTAAFMCGHIRSIRYFNTRLSNSVLQGITA